MRNTIGNCYDKDNDFSKPETRVSCFFLLFGHAEYADAGEDIVCAGISVLVINTINALGMFTKEQFRPIRTKRPD